MSTREWSKAPTKGGRDSPNNITETKTKQNKTIHNPPTSPPAVSDMYRTLSDGAAAGMPGYLMASFFPDFDQLGGSDAPGDRAGAASRNHREAEKRRRERIKIQLDRLRTLLACDPKTDKASLLAKAVEHVRGLKQQTAEIAEAHLFPTETDEIVVLPGGGELSGGRRSLFKASFCCEDRPDLLPELNDTLRSLGLKTLKAEIATLGGRVRNVMVLARETEDIEEEDDGCGGGGLLRDALKALVDRPVSGLSLDRSKRRRVVERATA